MVFADEISYFNELKKAKGTLSISEKRALKKKLVYEPAAKEWNEKAAQSKIEASKKLPHATMPNGTTHSSSTSTQLKTSQRPTSSLRPSSGAHSSGTPIPVNSDVPDELVFPGAENKKGADAKAPAPQKK